MLPRKALRRSGPRLVLGSFDAEIFQQKTSLQIIKYKACPYVNCEPLVHELQWS